MTERKPLGLGLIGCGGFGGFCLEAFGSLADVRIAAVADVDRQAAERLAARHDVPAFTDPLELIRRRDVDLVHVATPPRTHHSLALEALRAGKHVLCEKPLATRAAHARQIVAAAQAAGLICPVNFVLRHNRVTDAVKATIDCGALGKVLAARLTNCAGDSKLGPEHWFWNKEESGGIFIEHGVHFFDLYAYWLGSGAVLSAHAERRENADMEDRVMCQVRHPAPQNGRAPEGGALASHYHGFDQVLLMDRTDHRIVCEMGDIRVEGWIPLTLTVDAAVDEAAQVQLAASCPGCRIDVVELYDGDRGHVSGRGKTHRLTRRICLTYAPNLDKQAVYAASVRALLADQIAYLRDPAHPRVVTESNGLAAVEMAEAAAKLAAGH